MKDHVISAHSRSFDLFASLASLAIAAVAGYALVRPDTSGHRNDRRSATVATLENVRALVRIKGSEAPVWDEARGQEELHSADQVFTDADSTAVLRFVDDVTVELGEHTLVAVERQATNGMPLLNILTGSLRAKAPPGGGATTLKVGKDMVVAAAAGTEFTVESNRTGAAAIRVSKGSLDLSSAAGSVHVGSGSAGEMAANGTLAASTMPAELLLPAHAAAFSDGNVKLSWRPENGDPLQLEVARDAGFAQVISTVTVTGSDYTVNLPESGDYFWRLKATDNPARRSEMRRFSVAAKPALTLSWPPDGHTFKTSVKADADAAPVDILLAWSPGSSSPTQVTIERDGTTEPYWRQTLSGDNVRAGAFPPGAYTWRVERQGLTAVGHFTIETPTDAPKTVPAPLAPPSLKPRYEIEVPDGNDSGWLRRLLEDTAYAEADVAGRPVSWEPVPGAVGYRVEIASDQAGKHIVWRQDTPDASITTPRLKAGLYYLRIATLDTSGAPGPFSPTSEFVVKAPAVAADKTPKLAAPVLLAPAQAGSFFAATEPLPVSLKWEAVKGAATYDVEVLTDKSTAFTRRTRGQDATAPLTVGSYAWRARAVPRDGEPGAWSKLVTFVVMKPQAATATPVTEPVVTPAADLPGAPLDMPNVYLTWLYAPSLWRYEQAGEAATKLRAKLFNVQSLAFGYRFTDAWAFDADAQRLATTVLDRDVATTNGRALLRYGFGETWHGSVAAGLGWREVPVIGVTGPGTISLHQAATKGPALGFDLSWRIPDAVPFSASVKATVGGADKRREVEKVTAWSAGLSSAWRLNDYLWTSLGLEHGAAHAKLTESGATVDERLTSLLLGLTLAR